VSALKEVLLPDIGDFKDVDVIEVLVSPGDLIAKEDSLITLESEKATMEVPSPYDGTVREVKVKVGDRISKAAPLVAMEVAEAGAPGAQEPTSTGVRPPPSEQRGAGRAEEEKSDRSTAPRPDALASVRGGEPFREAAPESASGIDERAFGKAHASPAVRRFARELGVDLGGVYGTGPKGRILKQDVQEFVKTELTQRPRAAPGAAGLTVPSMPEVDFSAFGEVETVSLNKIRRLSGANVHRNWVAIPHVTQFDEADITELDKFRRAQAEEASQRGVKLTLPAFLMKAAVSALRAFPEFNASLSISGDSLVLKRYFHIGIAVETPHGLVVPVIRDVDRLSLFDLAGRLKEVSSRARERKLTPNDMQGGCFTLSSLGGIGGGAFTPIINAPEVAILGVARAAVKPVYCDGQFVPRLMLPLAVSYDHRVIDGAAGARFITYLNAALSDIRRLLL
jgi:pyruvate dehydrogenase E2 component (dihydrolipoamide acetyltransferase)